MSVKKKDKGKAVLHTAVEVWLIEHGGTPSVTTVVGKGKTAFTVSSPQFPDPLPTLAQAMRDYPCKGHGDRKPLICREAKKLARTN